MIKRKTNPCKPALYCVIHVLLLSQYVLSLTILLIIRINSREKAEKMCTIFLSEEIR